MEWRGAVTYGTASGGECLGYCSTERDLSRMRDLLKVWFSPKTSIVPVLELDNVGEDWNLVYHHKPSS